MKPETGITNETISGGFTTLTIDTSKAKYQGNRWLDLGDFGKRKFENLLVLTRHKERLKFKYI